MKVNQSEWEAAEKAAADFLEQNRPRKQQPGDITAKMAAKEWGICSEAATDKLDEMTHGSSPKLEKIEGVILENSKKGPAWRLIAKPPPE